jgi:hypothetical protein
MPKATSLRSVLVVLSCSLVALTGCRFAGNVQVRAHGTGAAAPAPRPPLDEDPALELEDDPRVGQPVPPSVPWLLPALEPVTEPRQPEPPHESTPPSQPPPSSPTLERVPAAPKRCEPLPAHYACAGAPGFCPEWECRDGQWVDVRRERPGFERPGERGF